MAERGRSGGTNGRTDEWTNGRTDGGALVVLWRGGKEEAAGAFDLSRGRRQSVRPLSYNGGPSLGCARARARHPCVSREGEKQKGGGGVREGGRLNERERERREAERREKERAKDRAKNEKDGM